MKIQYIFPETDNFREVRPIICWEHMYGWIDGYGILFDPVIQAELSSVPQWHNGLHGDYRKDDFIISPCSQATENFKFPKVPGIFIRPELGNNKCLDHRDSEKELLKTPLGEFYYPFHLPFDYYNDSNSDWQIGEAPAIIKDGQALAVGFEFFAMIGYWNADWPEKRLTVGAELLSSLLAELDIITPLSAEELSDEQQKLRLDFQSYGINHLFIDWLIQLDNSDPTVINAADEKYLEAITSWKNNDISASKQFLREAFSMLAGIRKQISKLEMYFLEFPHLGILFEEKGFFELEWPQYSRETILSYLEHITNRNYRVSLEAGGACWRNLNKRFPSLIKTMKQAWENNDIELTNGTLNLPYALTSPLALQYWQFAKGNDAFEQTFGKKPETYQCQENSLTPQMPEFLNHFGYKRALHITQNHGEAPAEDSDFIQWSSPGGHTIPSMTARDVKLSRKGCNYFFDLPLIHHEFKDDPQPMNYINFQDIGYVPYRVHMIRAHNYADVWGKFVLPEERFTSVYDAEKAPVKTYYADAYKLSAGAFYPNATNVNALSHYEKIFTLWNRFRKLQFKAYCQGKLESMFAEFDTIIPDLCLLEAHDCAYVQGQRRGEFYSKKSMDPPPYSRETLSEDMTEKAACIQKSLDAIEQCFESNPPDNSQPEKQEIQLPFQINNWQFELDAENRLAITYGTNHIACLPIDLKHGCFKLIKTEAFESGNIRLIQLNYLLEEDDIQTVIMDVAFSIDNTWIEFDIRYAPRNDFGTVKKWQDYLALEIDCGNSLKNVWRFNPNVRSLTEKEQIASPCYLSAETDDKRKISLINEGAFLYDVNRKSGKINWLLHVACETVHHRRMAVAFDTDDAFLLSRKWSLGIIPNDSDSESCSLLDELDNSWQNISLECFIDPNTLMISNLSDQSVTIDLPSDVLSVIDMEGNSITTTDNGKSYMNLKPFELALMKF